MKKGIILALTLATTTISKAQVEMPSWLSNVKLSGYGMVQYQASDQDGAKSNSFNLRMARVSLEGRIVNDFYWKTQIQFNGNTSTLGSSPKVVDLFAEWQKYSYAKIKIGQFKNPFTFENPMNPIDQGFMSYGQNIQKLAGFTDRSGCHSSNGRDIGLQLQGDFLKNKAGRNLLHYQVGVFNGQGINVKDVDQQKNLVGGIWAMPIKGMRLGVFGLTGSYARKGTWTVANSEGGEDITVSGVRSLQQRRYAFSAEYLTNDWTFRSEFIHSTGEAFAKSLVNTNDDNSKDCNISTTLGNKAQGVYALAIVPIIKKKFHAKARYDMYQPSGDASMQKTQYEVGLDYEFCHNLQISGEYAYIHDRSLNKPNYNMVDMEVCFRF